MATITLITDQGTGNPDLARFRYKLRNQLPGLDFELITAEVSRHDVSEAAYIVDSVLKDFLPETIHIVDVESDMHLHGPALLARVNNQWVICANNSLLSLIKHEKEQVWSLNPDVSIAGKTFTLLNTFLPLAVAVHEKDFSKLSPATEIKEKMALAPVITESAIRGSVIFVDYYGNSITNISKEEFDRAAQGRSMKIRINRQTILNTIEEFYGTVKLGEAVCVWTDSGYLQVSIYQGEASRLLGLSKGGMITIDFV